MKYFLWLLRTVIFLILLVFALYNRHEATVNFFGYSWHSPLVLVILAAFALGLIVGALGMWSLRRRHRRRHGAAAAGQTAPSSPAASAATPAAVTVSEPDAEASELSAARRHGL
ncbi:MAG: lipopolysaccharide assembly protein LapA domain-containing protein [Burkholderiaceae bacterium]|jgi:uncharacterized integral membrane protein|nr:lipopolysaccharide assembly protein LapA domain-containing protein [Burkholderiaceae bacterium]